MIASLKGKVLHKSPEQVIVDVGGVGYQVLVPLSCLCNIPDPGNEVFLHTYTYVREDALHLYGFSTDEERKVFTTLLGINGIGPKLALAILSGMPLERFIEAVGCEDVAAITSIPGLGKKTAARLILELKEKLPKSSAIASGKLIADDAVSALVNLGYKKSLAEEAVKMGMRDDNASIEIIIRDALKYLTGTNTE